MAEYICREGAIERIQPHVKPTSVYGEGYMQAIQHAVEILSLMPATDVQPIRHGRWECVGHDGETYWYRCSVCGHEEHDNMTKHDSYCCNCGARMDGDTNG